MVTREKLDDLLDCAPPGKAVAMGMAVALVLAMVDGDRGSAEEIRTVLFGAGYSAIEIDREGNAGIGFFLNIIDTHGALEETNV